MRRLMEQSHKFFEEHGKSLGLKRVSLGATSRGRRKARIADQREETPVDDVRRVRERLSREAGGDVHRLAEESRKHFDEYVKRFSLKPVYLNGRPGTRKRRIGGNRRKSRA